MSAAKTTLRRGDDMDAKKTARLGLLTALALILFVVELQIPNPIPVPGIKLGLANIITVYAVFSFRPREVFLLIIARLLLGTFISGNTLSLLFSLCGSLLCLAGMLPLSKVLGKSQIWLCSIIGAILHNLGQTAAAVVVMGTLSVLAYLPPLLCAGCVAGTFTGVAAQIIINRINHKMCNNKRKEED